MRLVIVLLLIALLVGAISVMARQEASATPTPSTVLVLHAGDSIQAAIDYAASQGANQHQTMGTTEQGGNPWLVLLQPGEYRESGIVMRSGVNIASYGERTVLIGSTSTSPIFTCEANATISGVTIAQDNPDYPALLILDTGSQCSIHRSIIEGAGVAIRQEGGFLRIFDTDIRNGYLDLVPQVDYPLTNPVGMNLVRSRAWGKPIRILGNKNALLMLQNSHLDGAGIQSTHTGYSIIKLSGNTMLGDVNVPGNGVWEIRDSDIGTLTVTVPTDVYGGYLSATSGPVTWHR